MKRLSVELGERNLSIPNIFPKSPIHSDWEKMMYRHLLNVSTYYSVSRVMGPRRLFPSQIRGGGYLNETSI